MPAKLTDGRHWLFVEDGFTLAREHELESLFAIGNGYVGSRGSLSEGSALSSPATFVAGVFIQSTPGRHSCPWSTGPAYPLQSTAIPFGSTRATTWNIVHSRHAARHSGGSGGRTVIPGNNGRICRLAADGEARQAFGAPWRADVILDTVHAAGRGIDAAFDSYIASRSTAILAMWAYRHTRIRYSRLEGQQRAFLRGRRFRFFQHLRTGTGLHPFARGAGLITRAGRRRGSRQSGG